MKESHSEEKNKSCESVVGMNKQLISIVLVTVGSVISTSAYIYTNEKKYHPFMTVTIRGIVAMVITYTISLKKKLDLTYHNRNNFKWLVVNASMILLTALVYAWCQFYLPQPIVIALGSTSPIFIPIFDKIFFGVVMSKTQIKWLAVTFGGVLLAANGNEISALFSSSQPQSQSQFKNYLSTDPTIIFCASIILLLVTACYSYGIIVIKNLKHSSSIQIMYFQNMMMLMATAILLPVGLRDQNFYKPDQFDLLKLAVFTCAPLTLGQLAVNQGMMMTKNFGLVSTFMFSSIISGYLVSVFRYGESMNIICLAGTITIVLGVVFMMKSKEK